MKERAAGWYWNLSLPVWAQSSPQEGVAEEEAGSWGWAWPVANCPVFAADSVGMSWDLETGRAAIAFASGLADLS